MAAKNRDNRIAIKNQLVEMDIDREENEKASRYDWESEDDHNYDWENPDENFQEDLMKNYDWYQEDLMEDDGWGTIREYDDREFLSERDDWYDNNTEPLTEV